MSKLVLRKCYKCGALVKVLQDCHCDNCGIQCCGKAMAEIKPNSVDAAIEKHVPELHIEGGVLVAKVNHVMDDGHYIQWISMVYDKGEITVEFKPGDKPEAVLPYIPGSTVYAYCNLHSLWSKVVE